MRLRRLAVAIAIAVVAPLLTVALAGPGGAQVNCGNDTWFDGQGWRDNPKIKSACDTTGTDGMQSNGRGECNGLKGDRPVSRASPTAPRA